MLEHPLWYAAFLLPTVFIIGFSSGIVQPALHLPQKDNATIRLIGRTQSYLLASIIICAVYSIFIHAKLAKNYEPNNAMTAIDRHRNTKNPWIFTPQIIYAQAMYVSNDAQIKEMPEILEYFKLASHAHMDQKFLIRYAQVSALAGDFNLARHLAWRSIQIDPTSAQTFVQDAENSGNTSLIDLAAFVQSGTPFNLPLDQTMHGPW